MLRCFDCNASAADAAPLVQDGSWMGPNPSKTATEEPVTTQKRSTLNTEYKLKFRPFSDYSYVDGQFSGARDEQDGDAASGDTAAATPWFEEVVELRKKASSYKVRGWGREMAQPHLAHLYDKEEDPSVLAERKIISALYLETLRPGFVREERGRSPAMTGGASVRQQSHPPPSSRKSPGATKMALKLHAAEGSRRPHSAQPATEGHPGDTVDRAKGRSPATPRTPTGRPAVPPPTVRAVKKRPSIERPQASADKPARPTPEKTDKPARPAADKPARPTTDKPARPTTDKPARPVTDKPARPVTDKPPWAAADKSPRPTPATAPSGTADTTGGKGIRGGTPRSRSAHRLAAKTKSPTKAEKAHKAEKEAPAPVMSASAPTASEPEVTTPAEATAKAEAKPAEDEAKPVENQAKPSEDQVKPAEDEAKPVEAEAKPVEAEAHTAEVSVPEVKQDEMVRSAPEPTRVKSPETMAPIKSPEPVNWTVPLDTGKTFTVTQNVMAGHGSPLSSRADSLRSPGEEPVTPYRRTVTDVSHLRNGEQADAPLVNDQHTNGNEPSINHQAGDAAATDPMTVSMTGDELKKSFHNDPMAASMTGDELQHSFHDPMSSSTIGDELQRSFHADPMSSSMTGDQLQSSFHADPMSSSMTGDELQRSFHADPMSSSLTGDQLQRSLHAEDGRQEAAADPLAQSFHAEVALPEKPVRVLDDPLIGSGFSREPEPPSRAADRPAASLFSSGSAGPPRFSHELFGSGRPAETKPDAPEKPTYRVI